MLRHRAVLLFTAANLIACGRLGFLLGDPDTTRDSGSGVDAGERLDAGQRVDAGERMDAGERLDAGERMDAGPVGDAGASLGGPACRLDEICRSIGTRVGVLYGTGSATISAGTTTVTLGSGANLPAPSAVGAVGPGDELLLGGETFHILSRDSATRLTVQTPAIADHAAETYTIARAFHSVAEWELARQGNLAGELRSEAGVAYKDGPFIVTATIEIEGSTTDASHSLRLTVAEGQRHDGTAGSGVVFDGQHAGESGFLVLDDFIVIEWLELKAFDAPSVGASNGETALFVRDAVGVVFDSLVIHDFARSHAFGVRTSDQPGRVDLTVRNSIIYNGGSPGGIFVENPESSLTVENCTVYNIDGYGIHRSGGTMTVTNSISMNSRLDDFTDDGPGMGGLLQFHNLSSDDSAAGIASVTGAVAANEFISVSPGAEDFHLRAGSAAIDTGTPLSFDGDIDDQPRPRGAQWDIGADEH